MRKHCSIIFCIFLVLPVFLHSQTAQAIEDLLDAQAVNVQQVAWLVLEAANIAYSANIPFSEDISESEDILSQEEAFILSQEEAFGYAVEQRWLPIDAEPTGRARFDQVSLLVMRAFDIRGGIFYRLFGSPHYAYRELVYRNVILGRADPGMAVSGYELLYIVNRVLALQEANLL